MLKHWFIANIDGGFHLYQVVIPYILLFNRYLCIILITAFSCDLKKNSNKIVFHCIYFIIEINFCSFLIDDENENLQQIIKDSGFLADDFMQPEEVRKPQFKQRQQSQPEVDFEPTRHPRQSQSDLPRQRVASPNPNAEGGVTVVSARSPSVGQGSNQGFSVLPNQTGNRSTNSLSNQSQPPPKYSVPAEQQRNQKPLLPHLSYSQRIETTSTPLQAQQQPSRSLRAQNPGGMSRPKEGSTDV